MHGGCITGHVTTGNYGGGIHINSGATFEMYGGSITKNQASNGGAIGVYGYAERTTNILIAGGTISENKATSHGGAIYTMHGGTWAEPGVTAVEIAGGEIANNEATTIAGGIFTTGAQCP